ncbi:MAG: transposase [Clostridia bacterium]
MPDECAGRGWRVPGAPYSGRGLCERAIRHLKATGLSHLPSESFTQNTAWLTALLLAGDLLAWLKGLCLPEPLRRAEPPRLRYTLLHVPARRTILRLPRTWPRAEALVTAFARCAGLPRPAPAVG